jgi:predicted dehydrogenase
VQTVEQGIRAFVDALLDDAEPPISALDGYQAVEIAEACYHAASSGEPISIYGDDEEESYDDGDDDLSHV